MKRITKNVVRVSLAVVIPAISIVLLGLVPINAGFLKEPLARAVREATGFQLGIRDPTIVRLGLNPARNEQRLRLRRSCRFAVAECGYAPRPARTAPDAFGPHTHSLDCSGRYRLRLLRGVPGDEAGSGQARRSASRRHRFDQTRQDRHSLRSSIRDGPVAVRYRPNPGHRAVRGAGTAGRRHQCVGRSKMPMARST